MFERFTEGARQVIVLAQEEARLLKHGYIGTEHILLGLLREDSGVAAQVLRDKFTAAQIRYYVNKTAVHPTHLEAQHNKILPFTPRVKAVLDLSLREALSLGRNYIGTEHILLGVVRDNSGAASRFLLDHDVTAEEVRSNVIRALSQESEADKSISDRVIYSPLNAGRRPSSKRPDNGYKATGKTLEEVLDSINKKEEKSSSSSTSTGNASINIPVTAAQLLPVAIDLLKELVELLKEHNAAEKEKKSK